MVLISNICCFATGTSTGFTVFSKEINGLMVIQVMYSKETWGKSPVLRQWFLL